MRSSISITWVVWKALFLREAVARISAGRAAWVWILAEPVVHLIFLNVIFGAILQRMTGGIEAGPFITTGILGFLMCSHTAMKSKEAIKANNALFTYRQVRPVDTVLVRAALEAMLVLVSGLFLLAGLSLCGIDIMPQDPLRVIGAVIALWFLGVGLGLMLSVAGELIPELGKVVDMLFRPLYLLSGIMYPVTAVPVAYQGWILANPLIHGIESMRLGFFAQYHTAEGVSVSYLAGFALMTLLMGLALHVRFGVKLVTH